MPSPAAAGIVAATVYAYPAGFSELHLAAPLVLLVVVPAALMVSTIRFRSFKSIDTNSGHPFRLLIFFALFIAALVTRPQEVLVVVAYTYLASPLIGGLVSRLRPPARRGAGRVIVTSVPCPLTLATPMVPPLSSTLRLAMVRPSPVPVALVEK